MSGWGDNGADQREEDLQITRDHFNIEYAHNKMYLRHSIVFSSGPPEDTNPRRATPLDQSVSYKNPRNDHGKYQIFTKEELNLHNKGYKFNGGLEII